MTQDGTIEFLSSGASYGLPGQSVERVETHCSVVFLAADRAYKLKRAIAFSALDYTSVEKREAACRREVELNRRTAPDLYLGIQAIRRGPDGVLGFEVPGPVVDWVVVMRRFDSSDLFDRLADADRLTPDLMGALADEIARFHSVAEPVWLHGGADGLLVIIEHNRGDQLTVASLLGEEAVERLYRAAIGALEPLGRLLDSRRAAGKVRRCHGDLRLANICLFRERPTLFDAIEFADEISCIDVLFDLAFLLMDLAHRGREDLASLVFNRYLDRTGDDDGLRALPLMLSVRAATRAYAVAASSLRRTDPREAARLVTAASSLMARAESVLAPASPRLIAIGGGTQAARDAIAAGLAARLAPAPGGRRVPGGPQRGRDADAEAKIVAAAATAVAAGYTALVDTASGEGTLADALARAAEEKAVPFDRLWAGDPGTAPPNWHAPETGPA